MNGVILINKDINVTSRAVVNDLTHIFNTKKIGHTGTLDPLATGVLVITLGRYTKLNELLTSTYKEYIAEFKLGILTDTLDITGYVIEKKDIKISEDEIKKCIHSFVGTYNQEVPIYSSVKVKGKKLYEYARNHETVELPKRMVDIKSIEILSINQDVIKIKTLVSKGTYIRSLIRDIGVSLGTYATMINLMRTKQGKFALNDCYTVEDVRNGKYQLLKIKDILDVEIIECDEELLKLVSNGVKLDNNYNKELVLFMYNKKEICLYKKDNDIYRMYLMIGDKMENIKNVEELLQYMRSIEYGFETLDGKRYYGSEGVEEHINEWTLQDAKRLNQTKLGHCFDQVEFERAWFKKHNYEFKTILVGFMEGDYPTHAFLVYKDNDKWYYFENSDYSNRGIHEYDNLSDIIKFVKRSLIEYVELDEDKYLDKVVAYEYDQPKSNITFSEFIISISSNNDNIIN